MFLDRVKRNLLRPVFLSFFWISLFASSHESVVYGQGAITLESNLKVELNATKPRTIELTATLIDGFTYRIPFESTSNEESDFLNLHGQTICQCASIQFDRESISSNETLSGVVLLKPKSADLAQTIDIYGTPRGEADPSVICVVRVKCKVFSPVKLIPSVVEIKEGRFPFEFIEVKSSAGVVINSASLSDSNNQVLGNFDFERTGFELSNTEFSHANIDGELTARFQFTFRDRVGEFSARLPYASKAPIRVIPKNVAIQKNDGQHVGRCILLGFSPGDQVSPMIHVELLENDAWRKTDGQCRVDEFAFGRAMLHVSFSDSDRESIEKNRSKLRFVDSESEQVLAEFSCFFQ